MSDITVLGIFVADISFSGNKLPTTGETILGDSYNIGPGGKGCNQAIAISRLGGNVNFISKLGNDDYGKLAIDKLRKDFAVPERNVMKLQKARPILIKFFLFQESANLPIGIPTTE